MDQAAILLSKKGFATHVSFNPHRVDYVPLPEGVKFVVIDSNIRSAKAETASLQFNKRVFECQLAVGLLSRALNLSLSPWSTLKDVQLLLNKNFSEMLKLTETHIPFEKFNKSDLIKELGLPFIQSILNRVGDGVWELNSEFYPRQRARHVYSEAARVEKFVDVGKHIFLFFLQFQSIHRDKYKRHVILSVNL